MTFLAFLTSIIIECTINACACFIRGRILSCCCVTTQARINTESITCQARIMTHCTTGTMRIKKIWCWVTWTCVGCTGSSDKAISAYCNVIRTRFAKSNTAALADTWGCNPSETILACACFLVSRKNHIALASHTDCSRCTRYAPIDYTWSTWISWS